jgi:predicted O-methyltransferase YrrM
MRERKNMSGVTKDGMLKKYKKPMRWDAILKRLPKNTKLKGAEIGVLNGNTAGRLLRARPSLIHIMVDPWCVPDKNSTYYKSADSNARKALREHEAAYKRTLRVTRFAGKRARVMRMTSKQAAPQIKNGSLDFVFIDGDHSYEGTKKDIILWLPKIKPGGWIGGHDYKHEKRPDLHGIDKAVEEFFSKDQIKIDVNHTWFVKL